MQGLTATAGLAIARRARAAGRIFDPTAPEYGAVRGRMQNPAQSVEVAQRNQKAFQACANAFTAAVKGGDREATFVFPAGDFLICAVPYVGANYVGTERLTSGWTHHSIVFDAGVFSHQEVTGGRLVGEGGTIIRIENDPLLPSTNGGSNNSTVLVLGKWRGLRHTGLVHLEGFQVDSQADRLRGTTSGDSWQFSFGVREFAAEHLWGWKGTNAAFAINLNKRGPNSSSTAPQLGFNMRPEAICSDFDIQRVTAINGEHGALINSAANIRLGAMTVSQREYEYRGVLQKPYQQRGIYLLNAHRLNIGSLDIQGVHHVGLHCAVRDASRTAFDLDVTIGEASVAFDGNKELDPDRYTGVELNNNNNGIGPARTISLRIGRLRTRGVRSTLVWREGNKYGGESHAVLKKLTIGELDCASQVRGIYLRPRSGAGEIEIGRGRLSVSEESGASNRAPQDGVTIEPEAALSEKRARTKPISLATLRGYSTWDGRKERKARNALEPGTIKFVEDWPGGARVVILDPRTGSPDAISGWRPVRTVNRIGSCSMGSVVIECDSDPGRFFGIARLSFDGTTFVQKSAAAKLGSQKSERAKRKAGRSGISIEDCSVVRDNYTLRSD